MLATKHELQTLKGIIYIIRNKINWKRYIGQTNYTFNERYCKAGWWKNESITDFFRNAINKYGHENFEIEIILSGLKTQEVLDAWEIFYIDYFKSNDRKYGYNLREGGAGGKLNEDAKNAISLAKRLTFEEIIIRSKTVHGDKYEYLEDIPTRKIEGEHGIKIRCKKCDKIFDILVHNHLREGALGGCKKCAAAARKQNCVTSFEEFVKKANKRFPNEFIYNKEGYFDSFSDIKIKHKICNTEFIQRVNRHLKYLIGCPKCAAEDRFNRLRNIICLHAETNEIIKIFRSRKNAANELGLDSKKIDMAAKNNKIYAGFLWKYRGKDYEFQNLNRKNVDHYNYYL